MEEMKNRTVDSEPNYSARKMEPTEAISFWQRLRKRSFLYYGLRFLRRPIFSLAVARAIWHESKHPDQPMLAPDTLPFLETHLKKDHLFFEWGSGGSTAWLAKRCGKIVSIEDSSEWYERNVEIFKEQEITNVDYRYVPIESNEECANGVKLPSYVLQAGTFEDDSIDFCLVDGRYRQACALAVISKMKPGGYLIVDDTHGQLPLTERGVPESWEIALQAKSTLKQTTVWQKPK